MIESSLTGMKIMPAKTLKRRIFATYLNKYK
jgi:hypothetical protein